MEWVRTWSPADVALWLEAHQLDHLKPYFASSDGQVGGLQPFKDEDFWCNCNGAAAALQQRFRHLYVAIASTELCNHPKTGN